MMRFAREFGWTFDQVRQMRASDVLFILNAWGVEDQVRKARGKK